MLRKVLDFKNSRLNRVLYYKCTCNTLKQERSTAKTYEQALAKVLASARDSGR